MTQCLSYQASHHLTISDLHNILSHLPPLSLLHAQLSLMRTYLVSAMNDLEQFKDVGFVCVQLFDIYIYYDWAVTGKILLLFPTRVL